MVSLPLPPSETPDFAVPACVAPADVARLVREAIEGERRFGLDPPLAWPVVNGVESSRPKGAPPTVPGSAAATERFDSATVTGPRLDAERARRRALLDPIAAEASACTACVLCEKRRQAVFGVGDPCARLMFVGEGPGADEDRQGEPFVGAAGQLLDRMIQAMGLRREQVYIGNVVKCRPPENRTPEALEIVSCLPYLRRQIQIIQPEVICALGRVAVGALLSQNVAITRVRGRFFEFEGIAVLPTFHPAYLLRTPGDKRLAWEDLQKVMDRLGLPPQRQG